MHAQSSTKKKRERVCGIDIMYCFRTRYVGQTISLTDIQLGNMDVILSDGFVARFVSGTSTSQADETGKQSAYTHIAFLPTRRYA